MVLGKLSVPGRPTVLITVGQRPTALAVGAGRGRLDIFTLIYPFSPLSPSLWETARYRLRYCLKRPLNPKQPINQPLQKQRARVWIYYWPFQCSTSVVVPQCYMFQCPCVYGLEQYGELNNSCQVCFLFVLFCDGFFHPYYSEESILHFRGVRLIFSSLA